MLSFVLWLSLQAFADDKKIESRWMQPRDLPELLAIERASGPGHWGEKEIQKSAQDSAVSVRVFTFDQHVVGYTVYRRLADKTAIEKFVVAPAYRNTGVSDAMAAEIVDPRRFAAGSLADTFAAYPHIGPVLPAMGYGPAQRAELARCIEASGAEVVIAGTPVDLAAMLDLAVPVVRARYAFEQRGGARLDEIVGGFLDRIRTSPSRS